MKKQFKKITNESLGINEVFGIMEFGEEYLREFNIPQPLMRIIECTVKLTVIMNHRENEKKISDDLSDMMAFIILTITELNKCDVSIFHEKLGKYCGLYAKCIEDNINLFK